MSVDQQVLVVEVPTAGPDQHRRGALAHLVALADIIGETEVVLGEPQQVELALDQVGPRGTGRVLEVGHPHVRAGVQRVDRHRAVDRSGDLDPASAKPGCRRSHPPGVVGTDCRGLHQWPEGFPGVDASLPQGPLAEQPEPALAELLVQRRQEVERRRGQDLRGTRHCRRFDRQVTDRAVRGHVGGHQNCSSSVDPVEGEGAGAGVERRRHHVEVPGADLRLVPDRRVAAVGGGELRLLQLDVRRHAGLGVAVGQVEHRVVEGVEAGEGDELERIAHGAELVLELRDRRVVQGRLPVERRRAVVGELLAGELRVDRLRELTGEREVGLAGLDPDQVAVRRIGKPPGDRGLGTRGQPVEAFSGALPGDERQVAVVDVGGDQLRGERVGAGDDQRGDVADVGGKSRGVEGADVRAVGINTLPPMCPHFFSLASWSSQCTPAAPAAIICLHQLERVERAAEARLGVGDDRREEVRVAARTGPRCSRSGRRAPARC